MTGRGRMALALIAAILGFAASGAKSADFAARGNEPGWSIQKDDAGITFRTMDGRTVTVSPLPVPQKVDGADVYRATAAGGRFVLSIADKLCTDTMSGMFFPVSVAVEVGGEKFAGCGGDPASLLKGEWLIETIDGKPTVAKSHPSLNFDVDNKLNGDASCNRYFGGYTLTGEGLTVSQIGSTMMMCEPPKIDQEKLFLAILGSVVGFEIGADGALILRAGDGRSIVARRAD